MVVTKGWSNLKIHCKNKVLAELFADNWKEEKQEEKFTNVKVSTDYW